MPAVPLDQVLTPAKFVVLAPVFCLDLATLFARIENRINSAGENVVQVERSADRRRKHYAGRGIAEAHPVQVQQLGYRRTGTLALRAFVFGSPRLPLTTPEITLISPFSVS